ncbi:MAG: response regulator [Planctomycetales bacterium]|nr:response regulator [Planctomycetales bacterium]
MAALSNSELATTNTTQSDAFQRKQGLRKPTSPQNKSSFCESDRVNAGMQVLSVLAVAAERGSVNAILRQVRYAGHGAHAAPDGLAALRVAAACRPDVVLLDMETAFVDGCQLATHLRSDYLCEDCLIIAFAERVDDVQRKPCLEAGIDLLLGKPLDRDVVETLLMLECVRVNRRRAPGAVNELAASDVDRPSTYLHSE